MKNYSKRRMRVSKRKGGTKRKRGSQSRSRRSPSRSPSHSPSQILSEINELIKVYKEKTKDKFDDFFLEKSMWELEEAYKLFGSDAQPDPGHDDLIGMNIGTSHYDLKMLIIQKLLEELLEVQKTPIPDQQKDAFDHNGNLIKQNEIYIIQNKLHKYGAKIGKSLFKPLYV